jgi:hypothetical protein
MGNIPSQESATPSASCRATQDMLLMNMRTELYLDDPCPFCKQDGIVCEVARHPPSLEGTHINHSAPIELTVYFVLLLIRFVSAFLTSSINFDDCLKYVISL